MMLVTVRNHINTQWHGAIGGRADGAEMIMPECTEPAASCRRRWSRLSSGVPLPRSLS